MTKKKKEKNYLCAVAEHAPTVQFTLTFVVFQDNPP
jgi:hypothetical protein